MNKKQLLPLGAALVALVLVGAGCSSAASTNTTTNNPSGASGNGPGPDGSNYGGNPSSTNHGMGHGMMPNIPAGDTMFFGTIQSVSGQTLVVSTFARPTGGAPNSGSGTNTPPTSTPVTVMLVSGTTFGPSTTASGLTSGTRVFGYGTPNSDGSINAAQIQIMMMRQGGGSGRYNGSMHGGYGGGQNGQSGQPPTGQY